MYCGFGFAGFSGVSPGSWVTSLDERVERVRVARLLLVVLAGRVEDLVDDRLDRIPEPRALLDGAARRRFQAPSPSVQSREYRSALIRCVIRFAITGRACFQTRLLQIGVRRGASRSRPAPRPCRAPRSRRSRSLRPRAADNSPSRIASDTTGSSLELLRRVQHPLRRRDRRPGRLRQLFGGGTTPCVAIPARFLDPPRHQRLRRHDEPLNRGEPFEHLRRVRDRHVVGLQIRDKGA